MALRTGRPLVQWMAHHLRMATLLLAFPTGLMAQEATCHQSLTATRLATQVGVAALVTGLEYEDMQRRSGWRMAQESNRSAIVAHPSSHLHAIGSYHLARNLGASDCESSSSVRRQAVKGAALSLSIGAAKEIADGWYEGFSVTDLAVDALGAGYAVAQVYAPALRHVTPTMSVSPRVIAGERGLGGAVTHYAHQTAWLSANVHELLPSSIARAWPSPLRVSVGRRAFGDDRQTEYVIGLDLDAATLPGTHPAWRTIKRLLHDVRLPGPAIVVGPSGTRAMALYW